MNSSQLVYEIGGEPEIAAGRAPGVSRYTQYWEVILGLPMLNGQSQWVKFPVSGRSEARRLASSLCTSTGHRIAKALRAQAIKTRTAIRDSGDEWSVWVKKERM